MFIRSGAAAAAIASALLAVGCDDDNNVQQPGTGSGGGEGSGSGSGSGSGTPVAPTFRVVPLLTDATEPNLLNPWGMAPGEGLFWIANNLNGTMSILNPDGRQSDEYPRDRFALGEGITGVAKVAFDQDAGKSIFMIDIGNNCFEPAAFIIAREDGKLIAISDHVPAKGVIVVDRSSASAVYLGVTRIDTSAGPRLLAADFKNERIDIFDTSFKRIVTTTFQDAAVPPNYGPFNVTTLGDKVYVAWAQQSPDNPSEEVHGPGLGFVSIFDAEGNLLTHIDNTGFNSPWGMAIMNTRLSGADASTLLVGNLGDGHITAFDATTHAQLGQLMDETGAPLAIDGLWAIVAGSAEAGITGALYYTAGPQDETHGAFGRVDQL